MEKETVQIGVELARNALRFAVFFNNNATCGQCREAIKLLFGAEVDAELANDFAHKKMRAEDWVCINCGQKNSHHATTCGRCGDA